MILFVAVNLKRLSVLGRKYRWRRPALCPGCRQSHLWGHGYVDGYFQGFAHALALRRYVCPGCGCVIKLRPKGYFARFQTAIGTIRAALGQRVATGRWPAGCAARGRHWLAALKRQALVHLGQHWLQQLAAAFDRLRRMGVVPVSRSFLRGERTGRP
jgi:hypothetical protein